MLFLNCFAFFYLLLFNNNYEVSSQQFLDFEKDMDIQQTLIEVSKKLPNECPLVLIYDETMPVFSTSHVLMEKMESFERLFIIVNLSFDQLEGLQIIYGANSSDPSNLMQSLLHTLYRRGRCYTFLIWVKTPRILYPEVTFNYHPGWRRSDYVVLIVDHIKKRIRSLINLRIWNQIPNMIALRRNTYGQDGVNIFTVFPYYFNGSRKSHVIDVWLVKEGRFKDNNTLFMEKFKNLYNSSIVLGIVWKEPFFIWGNKEDPYLDGLDWRLFSLCREKLNFVVTNFLNVNSTGRKIEDKWTGLLGLLAKGSIDVGVGGLSVTAERRQYFHFCRTYYTDSYNFIAPLNNEIRTALDIFFRPLSSTVWITTFVSVLIGILTLTVVAKLQSNLRQDTPESSDSWFESLGNNCGFFITIFCQKPYRHVPIKPALQSVYLGIIIMIFLLGMAFSSCLISVLLSFKPQPIADKIEDILATNLPISIKNYDGQLNEAMASSANPIIQEILRKGKLVDIYESIQAMDQVVKGSMIYIDSKAQLQFSGRYRYAEGPNSFKFHLSSGSILEFDNLGWPVNQNWPLTIMFDGIISRAVEGGIVQHWMATFKQGKFGRSSEAYQLPESLLMNKTERAPNVTIPSINEGGFVKLTSTHLNGVYTFYISGMFLATLIFIGECISEMLNVTRNFFKLKIIPFFTRKKGSKIIPTCKNSMDHFEGNRQGRKNNNKPLQTINLPDLVWEDFSQPHCTIKKLL